MYLSELTNVCQPCPDGADACFENTIVVSKGYWRINEDAEVSDGPLSQDLIGLVDWLTD